MLKRILHIILVVSFLTACTHQSSGETSNTTSSQVASSTSVVTKVTEERNRCIIDFTKYQYNRYLEEDCSRSGFLAEGTTADPDSEEFDLAVIEIAKIYIKEYKFAPDEHLEYESIDDLQYEVYHLYWEDEYIYSIAEYSDGKEYGRVIVKYLKQYNAYAEAQTHKGRDQIIATPHIEGEEYVVEDSFGVGTYVQHGNKINRIAFEYYAGQEPNGVAPNNQ